MTGSPSHGDGLGHTRRHGGRLLVDPGSAYRSKKRTDACLTGPAPPTVQTSRNDVVTRVGSATRWFRIGGEDLVACCTRDRAQAVSRRVVDRLPAWRVVAAPEQRSSEAARRPRARPWHR